MALQELYPGSFQRADVHIHTRLSDGFLHPEEVVDQAERIGLNLISITDHDRIEGSLIAKEYALRKGLKVQVLPGMEISSVNGHILAWDMREDVKSGLSAEETIYLIHRQGGLAAAAHPGQKFTTSLHSRDIVRITANADPDIRLDASEVLSSWTSRIPFMRPLNKSGNLYDLLGPSAMGAPIGSSDAHFNSVGLGETHYPEGMSFREAVINNQTIAVKTDLAELRNLGQMIWFGYETARWTVYEDPRRAFLHAARQLRKRFG